MQGVRKGRRRGGAAGRRQKVRLHSRRSGNESIPHRQLSKLSNEQRVIHDYHGTSKKIMQSEKQGDSEEAKHLRQSLQKEGGLARYQTASLRARDGQQNRSNNASPAETRKKRKNDSAMAMEDGSSVANSAVWVLQELRHRKVLLPEEQEEGNETEASDKKRSSKQQQPKTKQDTSKAMRKTKLASDERNGRQAVRLLDVGSIVNAYRGRTEGVNATCIDPAPRDTFVQKFDLLSFFSHWERHGAASFDCVVLAMVLNVEPDHAKRGEMLRAAAAMVRKGGLLLLSLPKACLTNSRYLDDKSFRAMCRQVGLRVLRFKFTSKLALCSFSKRCAALPSSPSAPRKPEPAKTKTKAASSSSSSSSSSPSLKSPMAKSLPSSRKQVETSNASHHVLRQGKGRNNFRIVLPPSLRHPSLAAK